MMKDKDNKFTDAWIKTLLHKERLGNKYASFLCKNHKEIQDRCLEVLFDECLLTK